MTPHEAALRLAKEWAVGSDWGCNCLSCQKLKEEPVRVIATALLAADRELERMRGESEQLKDALADHLYPSEMTEEEWRGMRAKHVAMVAATTRPAPTDRSAE
jgi:hypothetical protein